MGIKQAEKELKLAKKIIEQRGQLQYHQRVVENALSILVTVRDKLTDIDPDLCEWVGKQIQGIISEGVVK